MFIYVFIFIDINIYEGYMFISNIFFACLWRSKKLGMGISVIDLVYSSNPLNNYGFLTVHLTILLVLLRKKCLYFFIYI